VTKEVNEARADEAARDTAHGGRCLTKSECDALEKILVKNLTIVCAVKKDDIPQGALEGKCALCSSAIIFDPVGVGKVKNAEGQMPELICDSWACLFTVCEEKGPAFFKGLSTEAK
jgi:hypothetical protein